jgi:uncharacterized membrane protein YqjE
MTLHTEQRHDASLNDLVTQVGAQLGTLVRDELRLAQLEMSGKAKRAGIGAGMFGGVGAFGFLGLAALTAAAILALVGPLGTWGAALAVGAGLLVLAMLSALVARLFLRSATPAKPEEAIAGVKRDVETIRSARTAGGTA